jgi:hypothetical protein
MNAAVRVAAATAALALATTACGKSTGDAGAAPTSEPYAATAEGSCRAADAARAGDRDEARRVFYDRVHQSLHELAADLTTVDRTAAARLLETKEAVEGVFEDSGDPAAVLDRLLAAVDAGLDALDAGSVPCEVGAGR